MRNLPLMVLLSMLLFSHAQAVETRLVCAIKHDNFFLDLGRSKAPTYAAVITPGGDMLRLRYKPEGIDTLGPGYDRGRVRVPLSELTGVDADSHQRQVFVEPGNYQFVLQDANTAEGIDLHKMQCTVELKNSQPTLLGT